MGQRREETGMLPKQTQMSSCLSPEEGGGRAGGQTEPLMLGFLESLRQGFFQSVKGVSVPRVGV